MKYLYEMKCDSCDYTTTDLDAAYEHEDRNPDHWVQYTKVYTEED